MAGIEMRVDLSPLVHALIADDAEQVTTAARSILQQGEHADVLLGRLGEMAARGDADGHPTITLGAAAMLARLLHTLPQPLEGDIPSHERALPLFLSAVQASASAIREGSQKQITRPTPFFPSDVPEGHSVNEYMHNAIYNNDPVMVERILMGLFGTGADYRTLEVRTYDGISTTFQNAGHPLMFAVRGFQVLDATEWGEHTPAIVHWLAPHLPLKPGNDEPPWVADVRAYTSDPAHSVAGIRTRLSMPKETNALPLRNLLLSDADTSSVCQAVYDALLPGEASPRAVGSVIALAAADLMTRIDDNDRKLFISIGHGLLFAAAVRLVFHQVQDVEALPLLFTSAAYVNALSKEVAAQKGITPTQATHSSIMGGGLIAPSQLETLAAQLNAHDLSGALGTARRYLKLNYDTHALFAMIALSAARADAAADSGHTLQLVQAASEEFLAWPAKLAATSAEPFLLVALRAAAFGR
jgi:hypothetical protein